MAYRSRRKSETTTTRARGGKDAKLLELAKKRFKLGTDADTKQKERELEALRMYAGDQWPDDVRQQRSSQNASGAMPAVPARPCLVFDKLREPVAQILNQERQSDLSVQLVPADDFGGIADPINPAEIELREGLIRRIQRESESADARTWAFTRAVVAGRGYYAINTRYSPGKTWDQEIYCRRLANQNGVVVDPLHEQPDGSDMEWAFTGLDMTYETYCDEFPHAKHGKNVVLDCDDDEFRALGDDAPEWFTEVGDQRMVRVAEYWYVERESKELCQLADGTLMWQSELPEGVEPLQTRTVVEKKVKWCKIDGVQVLEETDWLSPYIPIIKIVGNELPPYNQERQVDGMVNASTISSQRGVNYVGSKWIETIGLTPISPHLVANGQIEGFEGFWNQSNTRAFPWLPYNYKDAEGNVVGPPKRSDGSTHVAPLAQSFQLLTESIQSSTGVNDPQLGRNDPSLRSGKAILAIQQQGQRGTSNYMDNFTRSVRHEGRIMNSLLYPIYGRRPGRLARIVSGEDEPETIVIGQPFVMQETGQGSQMPQPAPPGSTGQTEGVREYKLTPNANFNVAVKVTKDPGTRRQEISTMLGELLGNAPGMFSIFGDVFLRMQDSPDSQELSERAEAMLDPKVLQLMEAKKGGQTPPSPMIQQQMQQMQQQLQQTTQAAQQMQQELQTQAFKVQSDERIAMAKMETEKQIAAAKLENERLIAGAKMDAEARRVLEKNEADLQRQRDEADQALNEIALEAALQPAETVESV